MNALTRCFSSYWSSSIGRKLIVALTGLVLTLFLLGHMAGNLLVFVGTEAFNSYAVLLHHLLHGAGIWIARLGLLTSLLLHIAATISLVLENRAARKPYEHQATIQASRSSRIMIVTGLTILAFVIFHILQFTVRVSYPADAFVDPLDPTRFNAWKMVIVGFSNPLVVLFYLIAMTMLCSHLSHGVQSIFQTLGLRSKKSASAIDLVSKGYAALIWIGFVSIPIAIYLFHFGR
jgi:succinate dehydrogenase / fumarate reductase cytochrome b subunit